MAHRQDLAEQRSVDVSKLAGHQWRTAVRLFAAAKRASFSALDITTGQTLWTGEGRLAENASLVRTGKLIWALTTRGDLIAFRDSEKEFSPVARYQVSSTSTWATPVILNGGVLVEDESQLKYWAFEQAPAPCSGASRGGTESAFRAEVGAAAGAGHTLGAFFGQAASLRASAARVARR